MGFVGNRTECALLMMLRTWDADYTVIREKYAPVVERVWDFDSAKKMASVLIRTSDGYRLYNKALFTAPIALYNFMQHVHDLQHHMVNAVHLHCCHCWLVAETVTKLQCWTEASIPGKPSCPASGRRSLSCTMPRCDTLHSCMDMTKENPKGAQGVGSHPT